MKYEDRYKLDRILHALEVVNDASPEQIERAKSYAQELSDFRAWLSAENQWMYAVKNWLAAENRWKTQTGLHTKNYAAAKAGWSKMKEVVPNLDGVRRFEDLSESLQFRYAVFASAVNGWDSPPEVRSKKQLTLVTD